MGAVRDSSPSAWLTELLGADPGGWRQPAATISRGRLLSSAGFVWLSTIAWPCWRAEATRQSWALWLACAVALGLPFAGAFVHSQALGRAVGLWGFVAAALCPWLLLGGSLEINQVEPLRGLVGSLGWALFAFTWGSVRRSDAIPEENPLAVVDLGLTPRGRLPLSALLGLGIGLGGSVLLIGLAWFEARPAHALFAHAAALASALGLVHVGTQFAALDVQRASSATARIQAVAVPLALALVWGIAGAIYWYAQ